MGGTFSVSMPSKGKSMFRLAILITFVLPSLATAQERDPWIGRRVFWKTNAIAKVGMETVEITKISFPTTVGDVNGDWLWLGRGWVQKKDVMDTQQALEFYTEKIRLNPTSAYDWRSRAAVWHEKGEIENAIKDSTEAIRLDPKFRIAYITRGLAHSDKGDFDVAIKDYTEAIRLDPKNVTAYINRGNSLSNKGDLDASIKDLTEAIRLDPQNAIAYHNRGNALSVKGNFDTAVKDYTEAIRLDPKYSSPFNGLAWLYATYPDDKYRDGKKAVELATKACALSAWKDHYDVDTLAAAYAESGDWTNAVKYQEKVIEMVTTDKGKVESQERLALYKRKQPYREEVQKK
jgi:tetratricopeptide (TPR) repeat protein